MHGRGLHLVGDTTRRVPTSGAVGLWSSECVFDTPLVAMPCAEAQLVVRFGPSTRDGLDLHVMGARQHARRKLIRGGQRTVVARLPLGAHEAAFGVPSSELADRITPLDALWGDAATRQLSARLSEARELGEAAALLEHALAERIRAREIHAPTQLALAAATRLAVSRVGDVADELGVSERNLRRVFRQVVGMGPKEFAKLTRFQRALHRARTDRHADWANIAVATGYYDQAHLIAEFRDITGVTPRSLLQELAPGVRDTAAQRAAALRASR